MIRKTKLMQKLLAVFLIAAHLAACSQSSTSHLHDEESDNLIEDPLDIETDFIASKFMELCAISNQLNLDPEKGSNDIPTDWRMANERELKQFKLPNLRRKILEIPGGGGQFRDAQQVFYLPDDETPLIANVQHRVGRKSLVRVRSDCIVYAFNREGLSTCAAMGNLIGKAPQSNMRMKESGDHFIRWSIAKSEETTHFKCSVHMPKGAEIFNGIIVSRITDHLKGGKRKQRISSLNDDAPQTEDR